MKNPLKKPTWKITIEPTSDTEIRSKHDKLTMEQAMFILRAILADYEKELNGEKEEV